MEDPQHPLKELNSQEKAEITKNLEDKEYQLAELKEKLKHFEDTTEHDDAVSQIKELENTIDLIKALLRGSDGIKTSLKAANEENMVC